jgi:hypothetical protein
VGGAHGHALSIPVRLFLARSCEPAAGRKDNDKWLENRGTGLGIRDTGANPGHGKCSDEWRLTSREPEPRVPSLAPSQCPPHSPASFIGGRVEEDEGKISVGGGAARKVTAPPARPSDDALPLAVFSPAEKENTAFTRLRTGTSEAPYLGFASGFSPNIVAVSWRLALGLTDKAMPAWLP